LFGWVEPCPTNCTSVLRPIRVKGRLDAQFGVPSEELSILKGKVFPLPLSRESATGRAILDRSIIHIPDIRGDATFHTPFLQHMTGYRTVLAVPMLCEGVPIGALALWRREVEPFSEREVRMVSGFAAQAVIAIENTRLFEAEQASKHELQESLEYQTATSEVLDIILVVADWECVLRILRVPGPVCGSAFEAPC
jgi:GAF domain-containing protein